MRLLAAVCKNTYISHAITMVLMDAYFMVLFVSTRCGLDENNEELANYSNSTLEKSPL